MYWITGILGFALVVAPFIFGYSDNPVALWTSLILGGAVMVDSYIEKIADDKGQWEYVVAEIVGLFAIVAPFTLGFGHITQAVWMSAAVGILLIVISGAKLFYDQKSFN